MTHPPGWGGSPPPSSRPSSSDMPHLHDLNGHAVPFLLGQLVTQGTHATAMLRETREDVREIRSQLTDGRARMDGHEGRIRSLESAKPAAAAAADQPSRLERLVMRWASVLVPLSAVLATGTEKDLLEIAKAALLAGLK